MPTWIMRLRAYPAMGISQEVDLVTVGQRLGDWHHQAGLSPLERKRPMDQREHLNRNLL